MFCEKYDTPTAYTCKQVKQSKSVGYNLSHVILTSFSGVLIKVSPTDNGSQRESSHVPLSLSPFSSIFSQEIYRNDKENLGRRRASGQQRERERVEFDHP